MLSHIFNLTISTFGDVCSKFYLINNFAGFAVLGQLRSGHYLWRGWHRIEICFLVKNLADPTKNLADPIVFSQPILYQYPRLLRYIDIPIIIVFL